MINAHALIKETFGVDDATATELMKLLDGKVIAAMIAKKVGETVTFLDEKDSKGKGKAPAPAKAEEGAKPKKPSVLGNVREFMTSRKGKAFKADAVAEHLKIDSKYARSCLYYLYKNGVLKSEEEGIYYA